MELDVNISRDGDVPWGFELVGGADCGIPLTIVKVQPSSLAKSAGLQDGDKVIRINNKVVSDLTYDQVRKLVSDSGNSLSFGVSRGLYDPVLDDQEPLYGPEDFDQPSSEPTEVFQIQTFIEPPNLAETDPEFNRSLNASPFVVPTKPYRPFSTEPLPDVPPLEDPIILNPYYRDEFGNLRNGEEENVETKFKLPISEKYDPNALKKQCEGRVDFEAAFTSKCSQDVRGVYGSQTGYNNTGKNEQIIIKDMRFTEETKVIERITQEKITKDVKIVDTREEITKEDLEIQKIEETAKLIVDDSIERAVSVAEEIKKEMHDKIDKSEVKTEEKESMELVESKMRKESMKKESEEISSTQKVEMDDKIEEDDRKAEIKVEKNMEKFQTVEQEQRIEERKQSIRQEIEETIEVGSVKKKAEVFSNEEQSNKAQRKDYQAVEEPMARKVSIVESQVKTEMREQNSLNEADMESKESVSKTQTAERSQKEVKVSAESAEQRAYTIGLQTIPNIRGTVHSSYHYDLLLKTFFIHLTDVMVALSRFILSEPVFPKLDQTHDGTSVSQQRVTKTVDVKKEQRVSEAKRDEKQAMENQEEAEKKVVQKEQFEKEMKDKILEKKETKSFKSIVKEEIVGKHREQKKMGAVKEKLPEKVVQKEENKQEMMLNEVKYEKRVEQQIIKEDVKGNNVPESEIIEKKKQSGAKMAQLSEKKCEELTQKMGAVISEFQTKAVEQFAERVESGRRRSRSSSRSRIEEEIMRENDPLDWLEKHDSRKLPFAETKTEFSNQFSESKKFQSMHESKQYKTFKPKPGKQTYIAIVESHVYTNRDAILEDYAAEMSETAPMQSAKETNTAYQSMEATTTENVAFSSSLANKQVAQSMVEKSREFSMASAKREATAQVINERLYEAQEAKQEKYEQFYAHNKQEAREVITQALQEVIEPVTEFKQTEEIKMHEAIMKVEQNYSSAKQEHVKSIALAKTTEETTEVKETGVLQTDEMKIEKAAMAVEKDYSSAKKIYVQPLAIAKPNELKIEISETGVFESKVTESKTVVVSTIEDFKSAEKAEVKTLAYAKTEELKIEFKETQTFEKQELQFEQAAETIEEDHSITIDITEVDVKKAEEVTVDQTLKIKRKKPHVEASAELKIVKYEYIEPDGVEVINVNEESELKIKENIEINKSLQSVIGQSDNYSSKQTESGATEISSHLESRKDLAQVSVERNIEKSLKEQRSVSYTQEENLTAKPAESQLALKTDLTKTYDTEKSVENDENNNTPSPTTVPLTPLTDEYVFKLAIPLPKSRSSTPAPWELSTEKDEDPNIVKKHEDPNIVKKHEDPNIVKKKLIPHIETKIESVIYDPPLPTPPEDKTNSPTFTKPGLNGGSVVRRLPFYIKPGLRGGSERPRYHKEEIREIERKSSLLASAIDETIKSIEEYKEEVAMEMNKEIKKKEVIKTEHSSTKIEQRISKKTSSGNSGIMNGMNGNVEEIIKNKNAVKEVNRDMKNRETINEIKKELDTANSKAGNTKNAKVNANMTEAEFNKDASIAENGSITSIRVMRMKSLEEKPSNEDESVKVNESESLYEVKIEEPAASETINSENVSKSVKEDTSKEEIQKVTKSENVSEVKIEEQEALTNSENVPKYVKEEIAKQEIEKVAKSEISEIKIAAFEPEVVKTSGAPPREETNERNIIENDYSRFVEEQSKILETKTENTVEKSDPLLGFRPVHFDPESIQEKWSQQVNYMQEPPQIQGEQKKVYMTEDGEIIGTVQGIVDGLEEAVVDEEVAKELGKPGITEEKIAELISGEAEMLREAHVMGLARVLSTHMHRADDDFSVDFKKIKPIVESLNNSEVLKALNEDLQRTQEKKKKEEEKKWTTFLQKPKRPVPRAKCGYPGYIEQETFVAEEPYKVIIVKQPKPKVAPDYKPEDFDTGPLPWEQRAEVEASLPPVEPEEPILIPEEVPEFLEAVDPLPESEVPDLEDTGIPLPKFETIPLEEQQAQEYITEDYVEEQKEEEIDTEAVAEETAQKEENMEQNTVIDQLLRSVQSLVDPHAPLDQQLQQMRGQLAALAQLPEVIQQTLDLVTRQFNQISQQESQQIESHNYEQNVEEQESQQENSEDPDPEPPRAEEQVIIEEVPEPERNGEVQDIMTEEEMEMRRREEEEIMKSEKQKKIMMEQAKLESESRQVKQRPTPRVGKPKRMFGPLSPEDRAIVLPGGRRWRGPNDAYNEQLIHETLTAQAELIQGRVLGPPFESEILPYDHRESNCHLVNLCTVKQELLPKYNKNIDTENVLKELHEATDILIASNANLTDNCQRINFMKYEKPPTSLDHLQNSEVYKLIHDMDDTPPRRVEMRTSVMCEADYRERVRSQTPSLNIPPQLYP